MGTYRPVEGTRIQDPRPVSCLVQVHGRVAGGREVTDMPTMQGSWKELEKERFLNMVRPACGLCFACMYCAGEECSFIHHTYSMQARSVHHTST